MTQSTTRGDRLPPAERRAIDEQVYWDTSLHLVEDSSASVIAGLEQPVVGGMIAHALASISTVQVPTNRDQGITDRALKRI